MHADLIAAGLSPFNPEVVATRAGRLMLELIDEHVARGESFAFETTLAGKSYARHIPRWQAAGYHVTLLFRQSNELLARDALVRARSILTLESNAARRRLIARRKGSAARSSGKALPRVGAVRTPR